MECPSTRLIAVSVLLLASSIFGQTDPTKRTKPLPKTETRGRKPTVGAHISRYSAGDGCDESAVKHDDLCTGPLHIINDDGSDIVVLNERGDFAVGERVIPQESFSDIRLTEDHQAIGWLATYMMCAQSYACPLELIIYQSGHILRKITPSYGILWSWNFLNGGKKIGVCSGLPHGDDSGECELYDTATGKKLAKYSPRSKKPPPSWVRLSSPE